MTKKQRPHKQFLLSDITKDKQPSNECIKRLKNQLPLAGCKSLMQAAYNYAYNIKTIPVCEICGTPKKFLSWNKGYSDSCSKNGCPIKLAHADKLRRQTNLAKYGKEYISQTDLVKKAVKAKYGVDWITQVSEVKAKTKQTNIHRYGVVNPLMCEAIKEKAKATLLANYGVDSPLKNENIKQKAFKTLELRYGVHSMLLKPETHVIRSQNSNDASYSRLSELAKQNRIQLLFNRDEYHGITDENVYTCRCEVCGNIIKTGFQSSRVPICHECHPISQPQDEIVDFLKSVLPIDTAILTNTRSIIAPLELDIYIPAYNLAIEFNGTYYHCTTKINDKYYHQKKALLAKDKGIKLINIWEYDWANNPIKKQIIKDRLINALGIYKKIVYARKCIVKDNINTTMVSQFLNQYHIQGADKSKVKLGLFDNEELIAVMTFAQPRFNKSYQWELSRFCTSMHTPGAAGKLLKYFERNYKPTSLISYADLSWGYATLYEKLGFAFKAISTPNYVWSYNQNTFSRYQCQKHKLSKLLGEKFNPKLTEVENMTSANFKQIFDCGNLVYVKTYAYEE